MKSIFTGKVIETKWEYDVPDLISVDGWQTDDDIYFGRGKIPTEYYRIIEQKEIHSSNLDFIMKEKDVYIIDNNKYEIEKVEYNADNSITYHTNHIVQNTVIKSLMDILNEICKEEKEERALQQEIEIGKEPVSNNETSTPVKKSSLSTVHVIVLSVLLSLFYVHLFYNWIPV